MKDCNVNITGECKMEYTGYREKFFSPKGDEVDLFGETGLRLLQAMTPDEETWFVRHVTRYSEIKLFPTVFYDKEIGTVLIRFDSQKRLGRNGDTIVMYLKERFQIHDSFTTGDVLVVNGTATEYVEEEANVVTT